MPNERTFGVLKEVAMERGLQDAKWGEQNHEPEKWLVILMEEVGEASKDALDFCQSVCVFRHLGDRVLLAEYRREVAAVAVAAIEALDRGQS